MSDSPSDRYSALFAEYSHRAEWERLPQSALHEVKRRILDSIGVALAAYAEDAPTAAREYALDLPHPGGATLWGSTVKVVPEAASLANGLLVRYLDFNDTYLSLEPLHPSDVIPGLMALCQWRASPVRDLITAIAVAYEIGVSLCDSASLRAHGWDHVNYIAVAAACGAGRVLGLTPSQIEHCIAIAIVPHASMRQTRVGELSMWKGAAAANSVRNAVFAGLIAGKGLTGPFAPFEGEMGFFRQLLGVDDIDQTPFRPMEAGAAPSRICDTYIKKWPVEYHAQSAVDIAVELRQELASPDLVDSVRIDTFRAAYEIIAKDPEKWDPKTRETADHSMPYIVAISLLDGTIDQSSFSDEKIHDPRVKALLGKTTLLEDPGLNAGYPEGIPNRITIATSDGRTLARELSFPRGHFHNPMTDAEVEEKFLSNVEQYLTPSQGRKVIDLVWELERQEDLEGLMEAIRVEQAT